MYKFSTPRDGLKHQYSKLYFYGFYNTMMNIRINYPKNFYHYIKKHNLNQKELCEYLNAYPKTNRVIGSLPYDWIKSFPKNEIPQILENVAQSFSKFSQALTSIHTKDRFEAIRGAKVRMKKFQKQLQRELSEILRRDDVSVEYENSGSFKHCHKLSIGDYKYALSTFIDNDGWIDKNFSDYFNEYNQGKGYEPQNSFTLYKNGEHGRWIKPFIAKIARENDFDGFILSKFVEPTRKSKFLQGIFERKHLKIKNDDYGMRNLVRGMYCDTGGSAFNADFIENKELRKLWQGLARRFDETNAIFQKYKYRSLDNIVSKDIDNNVNIFDKNYLKNLSWRYVLSKKDKIVLKTLIKNLNYASNMKKEAEAKGLTKELITIFNKDLRQEFPYRDECWNGLEEKYYSKSFTKTLGISNKLEPKDLVVLYSYLPSYKVKTDYTQAEIIEGMTLAWDEIKADKGLIKELRKDFSIDNELLKQIKKNAKLNHGKME